MQSPLSRYKVLARRWTWLVVLGIVLCSSASYAISKLIHPAYQASAIIEINILSSTSAYDNFTLSELSVPTYSQLLTNSAVLNPVVAAHPGMTLKGLRAMMAVKPQSNTQLIELDVTNNDPQMAKQLAYDISQSLITYSNLQAPSSIQVLPIDLPTDPVYPKPLSDAGLGAVGGLGLAVALIVIFEWIEGRLAGPQEVRELLGLEILTAIPRLSRKQRGQLPVRTPALVERYRILSANLIAAQAVKPFKLVMVTSALANEGTSSIAANLACWLAMAGKQVLLVDTNLYRPALDQLFQLDNRAGLSNVFLEMWAGPRAELYGQPTNIPTLRVLPAGEVPSGPPDILQSPLANQLFEYFKQAPFDYIIFDAPPLLPVADAQLLASLVQAILLVVDADKTPRSVLSRARSTLNRTRTTILGVAINRSPWADDRATRRYANQAWQPETRAVMWPQVPPISTARPADTPRLSLPMMDRPPDTPRSIIRHPYPYGTLYPDTTTNTDPRQKAETDNHHRNGYPPYDTRAQR